MAKVLWPGGENPNDHINTSSHGPGYRRRRLVFITLPVFSLKERCFQIIRESGVCKDTVEDLMIPKTLERDYVRYLNNEPV